ncbi:GNAT family N-acetyltransferase [Nocardioides aurantiacus]|uniref:GNAT family N-acetyltransferase n=1 Tax=Nocardioides aurantiacus TaxID=86796 RepID=UPI00403EFDBC
MTLMQPARSIGDAVTAAPPVQLRPMTRADLAFVAGQHRVCFPTNVIGRLGEVALRAYYRTFIDAPYATAVVAELDGRACGFLVGIVHTARHRSWLRRHHVRSFAAAVTSSFAANPTLAARLVGRRFSMQLHRYRQASRRGPSPAAAPVVADASDRGGVAVLSHIATVATARQQGVGDLLLQAFVVECRVRHCRKVSLATLDGDDGAGAWYVKRGWEQQSRRQTIDGRWIELYDFKLKTGGLLP